jgi:hypothetical protein
MCRRFFFYSFVFYCVLGTSASSVQANTYPLGIFTNNGGYYDSIDLNAYVVVSDVGIDLVDFTFYNESLIDSSIARIYFDEDLLVDVVSITSDEDEVLFDRPSSPGNLPGGNLLDPRFVTTMEFSFNSGPPRPHNGIEPWEQLQITFDITGSTFADVIDGLNTGSIRVGAHVIALPDGSSESAVVPEPTTICLLGLGSLALVRRRCFQK